MMKAPVNRLFYLALLYFLVQNSYAQDWKPLAKQDSNTSGYIGAITSYKGHLYAYGNLLFRNKYYKTVGIWNGNTWDTLNNSKIGSITNFIVYKDTLYGACDDRDSSTHGSSILKWNGNCWVQIGDEFKAHKKLNDVRIVATNRIKSIIEYHGKLIVGGYFDSVGQNACKNIAEWNGKNWVPFGGGFDIPTSDLGWGTLGIYCMAVYNNELYVGGLFKLDTTSSIIGAITKWDGKKWGQVGKGIEGWAKAMTVYGDKLYVCGAIYVSVGQNINNIAAWDGKQWECVGKGIPYENEYPGHHTDVEDILVRNNELYVAGSFWHAGGKRINGIAKWNGKNWSRPGKGLDVADGWVEHMLEYDGDLYIIGNFNIKGEPKPIYGDDIYFARLSSKMSK